MNELRNWFGILPLLTALACDNAVDVASDGPGGAGGMLGTSGAKADGGAGAGAAAGAQAKGGQDSLGGSGGSSTAGGGNASGGGGESGGPSGEGGAGGESLLGKVCEQGSDVCGAALACCYPCGIEGCDFVCEERCDEGNPACDQNGCLLKP